MTPLKIAILWHQHQPYYKKEDEFILPWVRLHGVKDYFDLPELLHEYPDIKQTFNLVPSLMLQIEEYVSGKTYDTVQKLTKIDPSQLTESEKTEILKNFFLCNVDKLVLPYGRYRALYERAVNTENNIDVFDDQDWLDLQVWYNLTWIGQFSRNQAKIKRLFNKGRNFSNDEKRMVLDYHLEILSKIKKQYDTLLKFGQIEVSVSPMHHPILPLLCDSSSAREAMPDVLLPEELYKYPEDARAQVIDAREYYLTLFDRYPAGMWPSEGSISDEALSIICDSGIKWVASDEEILSNSINGDLPSTEKFFPRRVKTSNGEISVLFRDHFLSDNIGFVYSKWEPYDAARDFCQHLNNIRAEIINNHGEEALEHAVVPVILDGENCWEYYNENGLPFLRALYNELSYLDDFETVTCTEACMPEHSSYLPPIEHVRAGSWINANFNIWIGHQDDRAAWTMLAKARKATEDYKDQITEEAYKKALQEIFIAEGSDWFWWYGDEHMAENKDMFDVLFRWHIAQVYSHLGKKVPQEVDVPISEYEFKPQIVQQHGEVHPVIDGKITDEEKWDRAGYYDAKSSMSTMHRIGELLRRLWFALDDSNMYFRCDIVHELRDNEKIVIMFMSPVRFNVTIEKNAFRVNCEDKVNFYNLVYSSDEIIEFSLSRDMVLGENHDEKSGVELTIITKSNEAELTYPNKGTLKLKF